MSAFQVSKAHVDVLVFASEFAGSRTAVEQKNELGRMLTRENELSLAARYGDEDVSSFSYSYARPARTPAVVVMLKAIDCYEYQACEHDAWETSDAKRYCAGLRRDLIGKLPGYDSAPWGIEASDFGPGEGR